MLRKQQLPQSPFVSSKQVAHNKGAGAPRFRKAHIGRGVQSLEILTYDGLK